MKKRIRMRRIRRFLTSREFTATMVGLASTLFVFFLLWSLTQKDALEVILVSLFSGFFMGLGHMALTEEPSEKYFRANR